MECMRMTAAPIKTRSPRSTADKCRTFVQAHPCALAAAAAAGALGISALVNRHHAKKAENDNPPAGEFLHVNGVRLHYVERGSGAPLVLLHGNGSMIEDFESSGLITSAAKNHRVIVFDRPGFGHSDRPRNVVWTPAAQAELINSALQQSGVTHAIVLGHSWGNLRRRRAGAHISEFGPRPGSCLRTWCASIKLNAGVSLQ